LDLVALLLATQLKGLAYASVPAAHEICASLCRVLFRIGDGAMRIHTEALAWRPFDKLVCPVLVCVTFGIRCRLAKQ
jgi:hypothetical protein